MDETYRREPQKSYSRRPADSVVLVKGGAPDAVLSQSALWLLMPWFALAIGSWLGSVAGTAAAWLALLIPVAMAVRLRAVGDYLERGQIVVRNVLWTWRLDPPVRRVGERSSLWAARPAPVLVLRSEATGRRCKVLTCNTVWLWDELRGELRRHGVLAAQSAAGTRQGKGRRRGANRGRRK